MHNLGENKHVQGRQYWLRMKLKDIHTASLRNSERRERIRARRLLPEDISPYVFGGVKLQAYELANQRRGYESE
ncbi:hypothetical protein GJAV_G00247490 [Gymnothorax javanicus]|nr:hypothetical protein GJAV_G00247490 [Gymnothorax javanicus]